LIEKRANQLLQTYSLIRNVLSGGPGIALNNPTYKINKSINTTPLGGISESANATDAELSQNLVTVLGTGPKVPMGQELLNINPPKADDYNHSDDDDDDEDDDTRPLTRDELKNRTLNRLQRRNQNSSSGVVGGISGGHQASRGGSKKKGSVKK